jgi:hypothetical protein
MFKLPLAGSKTIREKGVCGVASELISSKVSLPQPARPKAAKTLVLINNLFIHFPHLLADNIKPSHFYFLLT